MNHFIAALLLTSTLVVSASAHADTEVDVIRCPKGSDLKVEAARPLETDSYCVEPDTNRRVGPFIAYSVDHIRCTGIFAVDGTVERENCFDADGAKMRSADPALVTSYFRSGKKMREERFDQDGQKTGVELYYFENGKRAKSITWLNGQMNGPYRRWSEKGKLLMDLTVKIEEESL